jgi:hypothetical protein
VATLFDKWSVGVVLFGGGGLIEENTMKMYQIKNNTIKMMMFFVYQQNNNTIRILMMF